ncbi:MAG TPA: VWA domain-containing protein [Anaerohalosphaeraceae bacterium]|nr:VWA domain-containing protein [Anaerohalosphaeraceae bacterium]
MLFNGIPIWLAVSIAAGMTGSLVALHLLHRKYIRQPVPTLLFWRMVSDNQRRHRLGGRFNRLWTFLLLTGIALLLSLAAVRPSFVFGGANKVRHILVVDCRASMGIIDAGQAATRFDRARQECSKQMARFAESDEAAVIAVTDHAKVVCDVTDSRTTSLHSLAALQLANSRSEQAMMEAIRISEALLDEKSDSRVLIFTDHVQGFNSLPGRLKEKLTVFSYAQPVSNAALLHAKMIRPDENTCTLDVSAGCWANESIEAALEVYQGQTILQTKEISLVPHHLLQVSFDLGNQAPEELLVKLVYNDGFQQDNQLAANWDAQYRVFVTDDVPMPIKACVEANRRIQRQDRSEQADITIACIDSVSKANSSGIYIVGQPVTAQAVEQVVPTQHLYENDLKRIAMGYDMFTAFGPGLTELSDQAKPLLTTPDGKIAAAIDQTGEKSFLFLDAGLLSEQSTVWKQPQFPEMVERWMELTCGGNGMQNSADLHTGAVYSDLWTMDSGVMPKPQVPEYSARGISLYPWVLMFVLVALVLETIAYYRGVII